MSTLGVGIIGCGVISTRYLQNAPLFKGIAVRAVADLRAEAAATQAARFKVEAVPIADLLARKDIDIVVNLTVPDAHFAVSMQALEAGKHVYSEKPLAISAADGRRLVDAAARRGRQIAVAPDTVLGPGHRIARQMIDDGKVGRIVAGTASFMSRGMEHWHPQPSFYFKPGGGPVLDMGPYYVTALVQLIGPVKRVVGMSGKALAERVVTAPGPNTGQRISVDTPTSYFAVLEFEQGALISVNLSWDVYKHGHRPLELHGLDGSLRIPDPNFFAGQIEHTEGRGDWQIRDTRGEPCSRPNHPDADPVQANYRGLGIAEMAAAIREGRAARTGSAVSQHVLEVMEGIMDAATNGRVVTIGGGVRPIAMTEAETRALLVDPAATT